MQNVSPFHGNLSPEDLQRQGLAFAALEELAPKLTAFRRHLHQEPELSLQEFGTSAYITRQLEAEGIMSRLGAGGRGVLADLGGNQRGNFIALRADCDALPISEKSTSSYASRRQGVMHACGHDAHTAMLLATIIALHRTGVSFPVRAIFQPAEEEGDGALGMIAEGALDGVSAIVALHVDPNNPVGTVAAIPGIQTASCQDFTITIKGRGGHAARPHLAIDPIAVAAALITQIYQAIPRQVDSRQPVVVSICQIHAGAASNVIPDTAVLSGTIRALDNACAAMAKDLMDRICQGTALTFGAEIVTEFQRRIPGVVNDASVTTCCAAAAREVRGIDSVMVEGSAGLGAEDFADYLQIVPGCMMRLGVKFHDRPVTPLHTPTFDIDESALMLGSRLLIHSFFKLSLPPC